MSGVAFWVEGDRQPVTIIGMRYPLCMRMTLTLDDDVAAAVEDLRRAEGIGRSEAVNRLVRKGLQNREPAAPYRHLPSDMGAFKVDISDIGAVIEKLDSEG